MIIRHLQRGATAALFILCTVLGAAAGEPVHHRLRVTIFPDQNRFEASDELTIPSDLTVGPDRAVVFSIHGGLNPVSGDPGIILTLEGDDQAGLGPERWRVAMPAGRKAIALRYGGKIHHPFKEVGEEYARGQKETSGSISPEGIFLSGSSFWYPGIAGVLLSFDLEVTLPAGWDAVSQGERILHIRDNGASRVSWSSPEPQDEIFLAGGKYVEYEGDAPEVQTMVFLREPDRQLAERYLEATEQYLGMYGKLIGPYPYRKFALVENFWETGYGMPSFTLLGPKVIRFPFILHSSYPHEILHNYWGNSVYIDYHSGNWGEGLTSYLSDHLIKEQRNNGVEYRQTTLQKYTDYVLKGRDLPLSEFRSRFGSVTEAVGYGKSMMLFHMLRLRLGDEVFTRCLQEFYREHRWRVADFDSLRRTFEEVSRNSLEDFFQQWVERPGAPQIRVSGATTVMDDGRYELRAVLEQVQTEGPFPVKVPVAVTVEGLPDALQVIVPIQGRAGDLRMSLPERPLRLDVDPEFDVFRRLHRDEFPPALSQAFGSEKALILLPSSAGRDARGAYETLAEFLKRSGPGLVEAREDKELSELPSDRSIWVLGWENRHLPWVQGATLAAGAAWTENGVRFEKTEIPRENHSVVACARHPGNPDLAVMWIATDTPEAALGLGRKLPHYHKYSYLAFEGHEPENVAKGRWPLTKSPMTVVFASEGTTPEMGKLTVRKALARIDR